MDGVGMITQCPIHARQSFTYRYERDRERERERERKKRERKIETDRQTDRQTDREREKVGLHEPSELINIPLKPNTPYLKRNMRQFTPTYQNQAISINP